MSAATGVLVELIFHKCKMSSCINQVNAIYPISKFETNFVTSVQLKIFPLIHSKSGTIPTSRQNLQNLENDCVSSKSAEVEKSAESQKF